MLTCLMRENKLPLFCKVKQFLLCAVADRQTTAPLRPGEVFHPDGRNKGRSCNIVFVFCTFLAHEPELSRHSEGSHGLIPVEYFFILVGLLHIVGTSDSPCQEPTIINLD